MSLLETPLEINIRFAVLKQQTSFFNQCKTFFSFLAIQLHLIKRTNDCNKNAIPNPIGAIKKIKALEVLDRLKVLHYTETYSARSEAARKKKKKEKYILLYHIGMF